MLTHARVLTFLVSATCALVCAPLFIYADTVTVNFENPPYSLGTINAQNGWSSTGAAGSGCAVYDHAVASSLGTSGFGSQSLRVSNAVTSGCFGDQTFSKPLTDAVGETGAGAGSFPIGTLQRHFETEFDIASAVPGAQQTGLIMSVSPDRGDGSRMTYLRFEDQANGIHVFFDDVQGTGNPANFVEMDIATLLRTSVHHIKITFDAVDGPSNDIVKVSIDGAVVHVGTSWENYYRFDSESSAEQNVRAVRSVLFRSGGTAAPTNAGKGFLVDNLSLVSGGAAAPSVATVTVHPSDMATSFPDVTSNPTKWFFYNDETDVIDNTLGSFVTGPSTPPLGTGSVQISVLGTQRRNLATYQFSGKKLGDITMLKYSTYNPSAGNGGSVNRSAYLNFNVDFNGSDVFQRRLVFVPNQNGTVTQNNWKEWDALQNGNAKWSYSGSTWPVTSTGPDAGLSGVSGTTLRTWNQILADYPNVRIRVTDSWLGMRVGEPYADGYTENLDKFVFGTASTVTTFDFDPTPPITNVFVHLFKFIDGVLATAASANNSAFNIIAVMSSISPPLTGTVFTLGPSSSPAPYQATSQAIPIGGLFAGLEFTGDTVVGADCNAGKPFAALGYSSGNTLADAQGQAPATGITLLGSLANDKSVIIWNKTCAPSLVTGTLQIVKIVSGAADTTFNFTGSAGSFSITTSGGFGNKMINLAPGNYSVSETAPSGYTMTSNTCTSVAVVANQTATCYITNASGAGYAQGSYYAQASYYSQASYYGQGTYYSQGSYDGGGGSGLPPGYAQGSYYSQGTYYSQATYYGQGAYYAQASYYSQGSYCGAGGCSGASSGDKSAQLASVLVALEGGLRKLLDLIH